MKWTRIRNGEYQALGGALVLYREDTGASGEPLQWILVVNDRASYFRTKDGAQAFVAELAKVLP